MGCSVLHCGVLGGVGEWLIPPDCKSGARKGYAGSNPAPSTTEWRIIIVEGPHSSVVEHVLGKNEVIGSSPIVGSISGG